MNFSQLTDVIRKSGFIDATVINADGAVNDTDLLDVDIDDFGDNTIYFTSASDMESLAELPKFLIYSGELKQGTADLIVNSAHIADNIKISKAFHFVKSILADEHTLTLDSVALEQLLKDAINGACKEDLSLRIQSISADYPNVMRVMIIKSNFYRKPEYIDNKLYPAVKKLLSNDIVFHWKDSIVILASVDEYTMFSSGTTDIINKLCEKENLICTVSNHFSDITRFTTYYNQAVETFRFINLPNRNSGHIYYYFRYGIYTVLEQVEDKKILVECCHPALVVLRRYDSENGTDLFNTLKIFASTGFSKNDTAKELFIHRNTVSYRIQQIEDICNVDLSDSSLLFTFQLSFQIDTYSKLSLITY